MGKTLAKMGHHERKKLDLRAELGKIDLLGGCELSILPGFAAMEYTVPGKGGRA